MSQVANAADVSAFPSMTIEDLIDEIGDLATKNPRIMSPDEKVRRALLMHEFYVRGMTMGDVGDRFNLTREGVRKVFAQNDLPSRPNRRDPDYKAKRFKMLRNPRSPY